MMVLLVRELTHNLPSLTKIELYRNQIRRDDAKSARLATASSYLGFTLCEQSTSDTLSAVLPKHPQVINPLLARYYDSENPSIGYGYPRQRPVFIFELQRDRIRSKEVAKVSFATTSIRACIESCSCGCGRRITTSIGIQLF